MSNFKIHQFPYLSDNYGVLIHAPNTGETAAIDAGDGKAYLDALEHKGWQLTHLLITHHHYDHTDGLIEIKENTGCEVIGPHQKSANINGLDQMVGEGDHIRFGNQVVEIIETPGHTLDMINYYFPKENIMFTGDTLFTLGCGRVFEGTKPMMWESLEKFKKFPKETIIYSSHEYTLANIKFALSVDPENAELIKRAEQLTALRDNGLPTVPSTLAEELATNPFMRSDSFSIRKYLNMLDASDSDVFSQVRTLKDNF